MKVTLWSERLKTHHDKSFEPTVICEIYPIEDFPKGLIKINAKLARCCSLEKDKMLTVEYIDEILDENEVYGSNEIKCPYCGSELSDSWECSDDDTIDCESCGSEYSYTRNVEVSYTSNLITKNEDITELKTINS